MYRVGVTGNIGSGKSTVCCLFSVLGIPIYHADERAKWLLEHDFDIVDDVKSLLGDEAYHSDGKLNRAWIASKVFADSTLLQQYNDIIHPAVLKDSEEWITTQIYAPYSIKEAALLFESGSYQSLDFIICITAPEELRLKRIIERDHTTEVAAMARISSQLPEENKVQMADAVIVNDGRQALIPQVWTLHHQLLQRDGLRL